MRKVLIIFPFFICSLLNASAENLYPASLAEAPEALARFEIILGRSWLRFDAHAPLHDFSGVTHKVSGEVSGIPRRLQETGKARIVLEAATLDTDIEARNKKMRSLLETDRYPEIEFTLDSIEFIDESKIQEGKLHLTIQGELLVRGVKRSIRSEIDIEIGGERLHIQGSFPVKMTDFGIEPPRLLGFPVQEDIKIVFDLRASPDETTRSLYPHIF